MEVTSALPLSDDAQRVIEQEVDACDESVVGSGGRGVDADEYYEIAATRQWIQHGGYGRIALQFPDELLRDAAYVSQALERDLCVSEASNNALGQVGQRVQTFVLADTSYGSCCVDEVTAQHVSADAIVHYGRACLSPTARLPVRYVFGKRTFSVAQCVRVVVDTFTDKAQPVLVVTDTVYDHVREPLCQELREQGLTIVGSETRTSGTAVSTGGGVTGDKDRDDDIALPGRRYRLEELGYRLADVVVLYVGPPSPTHTTLVMTHSNHVQGLFSYNPMTNAINDDTMPTSRRLRRRYAAMQKARDAGTIGLVVGTLGVRNYNKILATLKERVARAGKKPYVLVMGKLNPAKLANFQEIQVYCLVGCGENSLVEDSTSFYQPIVTPYELTLALSQANGLWTNDWITKFESVMSLMDANDSQDQSQDLETEEQDDEPHFSVVTGKFVHDSRPLRKARQEIELEQATSDVAQRGNTSLIKNGQTFSTAAEFYKNKSWRGLEVAGDDEAPAPLVEGRHGIARGYQHASSQTMH